MSVEPPSGSGEPPGGGGPPVDGGSPWYTRPLFVVGGIAAVIIVIIIIVVVALAGGNGDDGEEETVQAAPSPAMEETATPAAVETQAGMETPEPTPTPAPETPEPTPTPAPETPAPGAETAEIIMIPGIQFDRSELTISADTDVNITADNTDGTHNFSVYTDDSATDNLGMTQICSAPCTNTVTLNLAAGEYFFRCDVHPSIMTGTMIVQ